MITSSLIRKRLFSSSIKKVNILQVPFSKLINEKDSDDMLEVIEKAYSENGLGNLAISGVPGYMESRRKTLLLAY